MTFVVVGGGFAGVETIGEINSFIHNSINNFYHNVKTKYVRVILVDAHESILPEVTEDLSKFTLQKLREKGVEVMLNRRVVDADINSVKLNDGSIILSNTLIWAAGVRPNKFIADLSLCEHDKTGRIIVNSYLEVIGHAGVFALGDCASILDPNTGKTCPPTAQHAIRQGTVVAKNIISEIKRTRQCKNGREEDDNNRSKTKFDYKAKGVMAKIGKRNGVGILLGHKVHGFKAWLLWRIYYLANLPTFEKKWRVTIDWTMDILFKKDDITRLKTFVEVNTTRHIVDEIQLPQNQRRIQ
jgi:NADH dehydrogenase